MSIDLQWIRDILESGNFDSMVGVVEDDVFEAKKEPYPLQTPRQKLELVKDVSALANASGGVIVLGLRTTSVTHQFGDQVVECRPFESSLLQVGQYQSVLQDWIYPPLDIDVRWYPSVTDVTKGLGALWINEQPDTVKPFLINRVSLEDGSDHVTDILFGISERRLGRVRQISVPEVHGLIRDGRMRRDLEDIHETLRALRGQQERGVAAESEKTRLQISSRRVEALRQRAGLAQSPTYSLCVIPAESIEIPSLFEDRFSPVVQLLANPPMLRPTGFRIYSPEHPEIHEGQLRRSVSQGAGLELWVDGTLLYVIYGDEGYLCWGSPKRYPPRINPLLLVETVYEFLSLAQQVYKHSVPTANGYYFALGLHSMHSDPKVRMIPGRLDPYEDDIGSKSAPESDRRFTSKCQHPLNPAVSGFAPIKAVYNWFGFEDKEIPYIGISKDGTRFISANAIKAEDNRNR